MSSLFTTHTTLQNTQSGQSGALYGPTQVSEYITQNQFIWLKITFKWMKRQTIKFFRIATIVFHTKVTFIHSFIKQNKYM